MRKLVFLLATFLTTGALQAAVEESPTNLLSEVRDIVATNSSFARIIGEIEAEGVPESEAASRIKFAQALREEQKHQIAEKVLISLLRKELTTKEKQIAYLELAATLKETGQYGNAQQVYAEYARQFPNDGTLPEVLLKQGLLYREMGLNVLALSRFYSVISSSLNLKAEDMAKYQRIVTQAQVEIAETYYLQENYAESAQFFGRILKLSARDINRGEILYRLVRCHSALKQWDKAVANARLFLEKTPDHGDAPEVRYCLAEALKNMGRKEEALREVMALLQDQQVHARANPERWEYWQRRTGRDISQQLMKEGDYTSALEICLQLVQLDSNPEWQLPIFYQAGLIYESLRQPEAAVEMFDKILSAETAQAQANGQTAPAGALYRMAKWRKEYVLWEQKALKEGAQVASAQPVPGGEDRKGTQSNAQ